MSVLCGGTLRRLCLGKHRLDILGLREPAGPVESRHPAQAVGDLAPVVEDPPVVGDVGAAHGCDLVGDLAGGELTAALGLDDSQDAQRDVAGEEVRLDVLFPRHVHRPGLKIRLRDPEGLLDPP